MKKSAKIIMIILIVIFLLFVGCIVLAGKGAEEIAKKLEKEGIVEKGELTGEVPENYVKNEEIFNKVKEGMTKKEVLDIAQREPNKIQQMEAGGISLEYWYYGLNVQIGFEGNEVTSKAKY